MALDDYEAIVPSDQDEQEDQLDTGDSVEEQPLVEEDESSSEEEVVEEDTPQYTVTIDGKEEQVGLDELRNGYMRQSHFTRQQQALAGDRQRFTAYEQLDNALSKDAEGTLLRLAQAYGIDLTDNQSSRVSESAETDDELDPLTELRELRAWRADLDAERTYRKQAEQHAAIEAELDVVRTKFKDDVDFDDVALLSYAVENRIVSLEKAYRAWRSEKSEQASQSNPIAKGQKRSLPPVEGGQARSPKTSVRGSSDMIDLDEALRMAAEEHGVVF